MFVNGQRVCSKCGSSGPFYRHGTSPDGLRAVCVACTLAKNKQWAQSHFAVRREIWRKRQELKPYETRAATRSWHARNREYAHRQNKEWWSTHTEKRNQKIKLRRARKLGAVGRFSVDEWHELLDTFGHKCLCCGKPDTEVNLTQDHIVPLISGGSNDITNIQPLCQLCNSLKGVKVIDFRGMKNPLRVEQLALSL